MFNYLEIFTIVSSALLIRSGIRENMEKKHELWQYIKQKDIRLYYRLRKEIMGMTMNFPSCVML